MNLRKTAILSLLFALTFLLLHPSNIKAAVLFQDDFNDNDVSDWVVTRNNCDGDWQTNNGRYGILINVPCVTETIPSSLTIPINTTYQFEVDMDIPSTVSMDRNFVFKYKDSQNWYGIHIFEFNVYLQKVVNGVEYFLPGWTTNYQFLANQTYHFKVEVDTSEFRVYINNELIQTVSDSTPTFPNTTAGLQASGGGGDNSDSIVWFDNVKVSDLPSTTPTPTPIPSSTPIPGPDAKFELPIAYLGRLTNNAIAFKDAFWAGLTAAFDHTFEEGIFSPFTGQTYLPSDCPSGTFGITCYDSHNGTDFDSSDRSVFSVAKGSIVFTSDHDSENCTPNTGGFGCVIIAKYPGNNYTLYAHLSKILVNENDSISPSTKIAEMGNTGCPGCGVHLHFGVLKPLQNNVSNNSILSRTDWKGLLYNIKPTTSSKYKPFCSYIAPNGSIFEFSDPSGWSSKDKDPWQLPVKQGGCGINSNYLWRFSL